MSSVSLREITRENLWGALELAVLPEQQHFVSAGLKIVME